MPYEKGNEITYLSAGRRKGKNRIQKGITITRHQWERLILMARLANTTLSHCVEDIIEEKFFEVLLKEREKNAHGIPNDLIVQRLAVAAQPDVHDKEFFSLDYEIDYKKREARGDLNHMNDEQKELFKQTEAARRKALIEKGIIKE